MSTTLRLVIKNPVPTDGGQTGWYWRFVVTGGQGERGIVWDFRNRHRPLSAGDLDVPRLKEFALVIEARHVGNGVRNPVSGALTLRRVWLTTDQPERHRWPARHAGQIADILRATGQSSTGGGKRGRGLPAASPCLDRSVA